MSLQTLLADCRSRGLLGGGGGGDDWQSLVDRTTARIRASLVPAQLVFLDESADYAVASCGRQCGKGYTVSRLMVLTCLAKSNAVVEYIRETYDLARRTMWSDPIDGIPAVLQQLDVPALLNETRLEIRFDNGSILRLNGADRGAWAKLRGQKLDLLVCDEMQLTNDEGLKRALEQVIPDCLAARRGRFRGLCTPDEFCTGVAYEICGDPAATPGPWVVHHWTAEDLRDRTPVWEEQLRWKLEHAIADDDPVWLREKRGLWVRQDSALLLPLTERSIWDGELPALIPSKGGVPVPRQRPVEHYAGVDFGFTDATAVVVGGISREEGVLREVHSYKASGLNTAQVADLLRRCVRDHGVLRFYGDCADARGIEDLRTLYSLPIVPADKHDKVTWISEMRSHLLDGRLRVRRDSSLHDELRVLTPDPKELLKKRLETRPGSEDHLYDAFRYMFRGVWTNHVRVPETPMTPEERALDSVARERTRMLTDRPGLVRRDRSDVCSIRLDRTRS